MTFSLSSSAIAQKAKIKTVTKIAAIQNEKSNINVRDFQAEVLSGATKITWKTSYEKNTLGFRIWRDDRGERVLVSEDLVPGGMMKLAGGELQAGNDYSYYDLSNASNVYYWLEAIDSNSRSRWFGPVYPQFNFDLAKGDTETEVITNLKNSAENRRPQTDTVDFQTPVLEKSTVESFLATTANDLMTNDPNALKMEVRGRGIYRVDGQSLVNMGFNTSRSANWRLFVGGVEQPMVVSADGSIEFFGQGIDTLQTDANVYWLVTDTMPGKRINRVAQKFLQSAKTSWTRVTAERKDKIYRVSSVLNGARENWFGAVVNPTVSNQTLNLSDVAFDSGQSATVGVDLQGLTAINHQVSVLLNGVSIGQINFAYYDRVQWNVSVPVSRLVEGTNTLTFQALGGSSDINVTEAIRINYPRNLKAQNNRLDFTVSGGQSVKLKGFTEPQVRVFDVTSPSQMSEYAPQSRLESDGTYSVTINSSTSARSMTAVGVNTQPLSVSSLVRNNASDLKNTSNQAKFLVIAPPEFKSLLGNFCSTRNAEGIQTQLVDVEDIYDEFNNGIKSADAIRSFLQYAKQNWSVKPDFVMFVGDASVDPRNYTGLGGNASNRVPSLLVDTWNMETVSDEALADFNNDGVGELATGRLPAKDETELTAMLEKIMMAHPMTLQEINQRGVHFVSDGVSDYDFPAGSRNMATYIPSTVTESYLDAGGQDASTVRSNIISRINNGPALVNYFGHASVAIWTGSQIFRSADAQSLTNTPNTPFMAMIDCLNGDFAETNINGLAEAVMKQRYGGANSVWAASGYNGAFDQEYYTRDFYRKVFAGLPLGEAARQTKMMYPNVDLRRTYVFFGDPTQPLVIP